jgi:hypothetical protein
MRRSISPRCEAQIAATRPHGRLPERLSSRISRRLLQRQTYRLRAADERQVIEYARRVDAIAGPRSRRPSNQTCSLVEADGRRRQTRSTRNLADIASAESIALVTVESG